MRYMMLVKATKDSEAGLPPKPELMAAIGKMAEEATKSGMMVGTGGLMPSLHGARVRVANGQASVIDGPFAETKELVGGYAIFDLKSKEEALKLGREFMQVHADIMGPSYEGELEIRPMYSMDASGNPQCS